MRNKELQQTLHLIEKVSADSRVGTVQRDQLRRAVRELTVIARSGKLTRRRVLLASELVAGVLVELVQSKATR